MGATADKIKGATNEAIGKAKQGIGEATGSDRLQGEGVIQEVKGKGQKAVGDAKEATKDADQQGRRRSEQEISDRRCDLEFKDRPLGPVFLRRSGLVADQPFTPSSSTSNISVAFGGMTPPAPRAP